ncbi:Cytochrome-like protein [Halorhabdus tiamatea SARL4B]|uniref:Cytochrome-like protein n=1 Tax=Halorhabdus tiamatea SARL4B TaxID=1033806 RepID=F7PFX2_9EURY|nr:Cytochrome-like protein [Halorhabdus tiamatea SARL4B]CCQ34218.1 cytochrome-like protein containing cupredoxin domain [Halorhabdus tiamatea SARL4B]
MSGSGSGHSEDTACEGWENAEGAIQSGRSYVHTFETTGEHEYVCIPHEAVGMAGTLIVE